MQLLSLMELLAIVGRVATLGSALLVYIVGCATDAPVVAAQPSVQVAGDLRGARKDCFWIAMEVGIVFTH